MAEDNQGAQVEKIFCGTGRMLKTQYGDLLKLSFTGDDLDKMKGQLDNGWVNVLVKQRREPSETGLTHYLEVDTWKPTPREGGEKAPASAPKKTEKAGEDVSIDDLPF